MIHVLFRYRKLVLVARRKAKLEDVAARIKSKHSDADILVIPADSSDSKNSPSIIVDKTIEKFGSETHLIL